MDTGHESLFQVLNEVHDEETFIVFIEALMEDSIDSAHEWQNDTVELFLECAHAWAVSSVDGLPTYKKSENAWKRCADILYMGKMYE